jgi:signal transduction histidine kinase
MFSHDFRNPLTAIRMTNKLLSLYGERMDLQRRLAHMERIEVSVRLLTQMLDDILLVAQKETEQLIFKPEPLDFSELLQQIIEEFRVVSRETHQISFESHFSQTMLADPRLLRQVASNLISNAVKYSPQGQEVLVSLEGREGEPRQVESKANESCVLTVQDHGIGISAADQARLFNIFQRGGNVGDISGTGLGLAIVKQAVQLHGGSIALESQLGAGSTFQVMIPVRHTSDAARAGLF